ncbi:MAG: tetratricopeptide repeat protein, partial [Neisseriaceae bacterium]|nr:tetratricopeptide repeat protein [Neisseriaceae bacterium]
RIAQLERRQNDLERSIAVIADRNNMAMENTPDETPLNTLADAQQAYQNRQYAKAVALLNSHLQENISSADEPDALWLLAQSHTKLNNCESAVRTAHQLTQRHTEYSRTPDAFLLIAQCQNRLQQKDSAKTTLRSLIVKYPNSRAAQKARQLLK